MCTRRLFLGVTLLGIAFLPAEIRAQRLPIRAYTTADGLAHNGINRIIRDSRGFLWFATNDGLSRFDGYGFSNFSVEQGLPHRTVRDLLETKAGELWVATFGGLVRFRPDGKPGGGAAADTGTVAGTPMFTVVVPPDEDPRARAVTVLLEARDGTIWCGTRKGLFRLERERGGLRLERVEIGIPDDQWESGYLNDLVEDQHGSLWGAGTTGLYRRWPDGTTARYTVRDGLPSDYHEDLLQDRDGRLWVGSRFSLVRLAADGSRKSPVVAERYDGLWVFELLEASDGRFWIAHGNGVVEFSPATHDSPARFQVYTRRHGLSHPGTTTLGEDADGNLWIGTEVTGAMKLARNGFVTYGVADGVQSALDVLGDATGAVYVRAVRIWGTPVETYPPVATPPKVGGHAHGWGRLTRDGIEWFQPAPPFGFGWVGNGVTLQTRTGEWWIAGDVGIYRFPAAASFSGIQKLRRTTTYTTREGLAAQQVYRLFEDSRGDIWASSIGRTFGLARWDHATRSFRDMTNAPGLPAVHELARSFREDGAGNVWVGFNSGVARYRNGRFRFFSVEDGLPSGHIVDIYADRAGRLWLASSQGGLIRVDNCGDDRPTFTLHTTAQGLSGNNIEAITEDLYGRIYAATGRGIDQLDPRTGRVRHFTSDDGLAPGAVLTAFRDSTGSLWFATYQGLSRFVPVAPTPSAPPMTFITALTVGGQPQAISAVGETGIALPDLRPDGNQLDISFVAPDFAPGENLRYQYRLEGSAGDWSPLTMRRSVSFASLSAGRYRFLVRAANADGLLSTTPAVVAFTVLPPFWLRWWFLAMAALALGAATLALHRYRLARALEIERVRTRIATDLHDDVGANLTRIAILSEVARRQPSGAEQPVDAPLASIATIARESAASMSDIVWAISPERDTLQDLVRKMREHAEEIFEARDIALSLDLPEDGQPVKVGVNLRRDLYLIFKEAVNNAVRHSGCTRISIRLHAVRSRLILEIADDGTGFDAVADTDGNGLASMRRRADRLGGALAIRTGPTGGTTITMTMPLRTVKKGRAEGLQDC